jgi:TolB-like protein/Tfp pilus assembly protein PilF
MSSESESEVKFEIGHVLFIDIVGYSKLLITEQSDQLQTLKQIVRGTEQFCSAEAQGKLLRLPTGDGGALVFRTSPEAPVKCAMEISKALKSHPELRVRMGIHSGPVNEISDLNEQANIAGAGINVAQRIMDCGDAGHILLSNHVAEDLEQYPRWRSHLHDLGECEVKHGVRVHAVNFYTGEVGNPEVPEKFRRPDVEPAARRTAVEPRRVSPPIIVSAIIAIIALGLLLFWLKRSPTAAITSVAPAKSIAVLPFENRSEDKANAYFADGIQDEILTRLSKIADLKVISRTSTQHYKSAPANLPEIAKQLGVANIVEGSVQKSSDAVRVNVQLIKAANDSHLWADTFDRKLTDIFAVESEVAKAIADQLQAKLTGREEQVIAAKPTDNPEAYDAYLRGLGYTLKAEITPANALGAQKYLREAVRLDPKFAVAWAELASAESFGYYTLTLQPTAALRAEAGEAASTAIALQPDLGEAVLAKGRYYASILKDQDTAERYFERARQLLPNDSRVLEQLARVAWRRNQDDLGESYYDQAERLDPRNVALLLQRALGYIFHRRFPEARGKLNQVLDVTPDDLYAPALEAGIAMMEGELPRAEALLAPLHPNADQTQVLEMQIYEAILAHRPAPIIARLKEVLTKPESALGYLNGELRFCLGWAQDVEGDHAAGQETWRQARIELESFLKDQPDNYSLMGDLALTDASLGDKAAAFALAERAIAENPIEKDPNIGPRPIEILARVAAQTGEPDRAIATLQKLLSVPYGARFRIPLPLTPALLRLDPMFDPLRNDPRFQQLLVGKELIGPNK